jgi:deazaflavin-dependent oxidoreductase (nitroreductase family)
MGALLARVLHHLDGPILRLSHGRHSLTASISGLPVIELTSLGARTGQSRVVPVVAVPDGDRLIVVASNFGQHHHPGWYHNLIAHPRCSVAYRGQRYQMLASEAEGEERLCLSELDHAFYPARSRYAQRAADRRMPVMILERERSQLPGRPEGGEKRDPSGESGEPVEPVEPAEPAEPIESGEPDET